MPIKFKKSLTFLVYEELKIICANHAYAYV